MGEPTTLTLDSEVKERLEEEYRHEKHHSWTQWAEGLMKMLPAVGTYECTNCGDEPFFNGPTEQYQGIIRWSKVEYGDDNVQWISNWFCSAECLQEMDDEAQKYVPQEPDTIIVGGHEELRTEFNHATFYLDEQTMEVGIPLPGAFGGQNSHGDEYDYEGEPVYIENEGEIVQTGVIESIIHEEAYTGLLLERDHETVMLNHPNEQTQEDYRDKHAEWYERDCPECGVELRICENWEGGHEGEIRCHKCDSVVSVTEDREIIVEKVGDMHRGK